MELKPVIRERRPGARSLHRPPTTSAFATFPPGFGRRFVVFVDTEEEFDWSRPFSRQADSTGAISALPAANRRFAERGVVPTYLIDFPVADTEASAAALQQIHADGTADIGAHLHPWVTPPHDEPLTVANSFAGMLPEALEAAKLKVLTERILQRFGEAPTAYRAGRYGVGANSAKLLARAGYRLDLSVRSFFDYSREGGPDFTHFPLMPYWIDDHLLELPLSTCLAGGLRGWPGLSRYDRLRGPLARTGLLNRIPLTPEGVPIAEAKWAIETLLKDGIQLFSLSFHSPSLAPGHTPYVRNAADLDRFWAWWDAVLELFARHNVLPIRSGEITAAAELA